MNGRQIGRGSHTLELEELGGFVPANRCTMIEREAYDIFSDRASIELIFALDLLNYSGFNLSMGCFGPTLSKIAPNGQIWEFTGSRMDHSAPNYVARLFCFKKNQEK